MPMQDFLIDELTQQLNNPEIYWVDGPPNIETGQIVRMRVAFVPTRQIPKGSFLVIPGRTEYIEKYAKTIIELNERGFNVLIVDNRGQAMSDRLLDDKMLGHIDSFDNAAIHIQATFLKLRDRLPEPFYMLSHSMGGMIAMHILLQDYIPIIKAAIFNAPMWWLKPLPFARQLSAAVCALGMRKKTAMGTRHIWSPQPFSTSDVTHSPHNFRRNSALMLSEPRLQLGGPTNQWINKSFQMMAGFTKEKLEKIKIPVLVYQAGEELIVDNDAQNRIAADLPNACLVRIDGAMHEIMVEKEEYRQKFWQYFDGFMQNN